MFEENYFEMQIRFADMLFFWCSYLYRKCRDRRPIYSPSVSQPFGLCLLVSAVYLLVVATFFTESYPDKRVK